ncbi:PAS domain-containing protein [Variovorax sp. J22R133]|uniref:hybrid sensor histidine kinase/response regulator n=1 Tax=Variovorax brevis TaxID=3053503 RepID=UPI002575115E|nr:PAS domain-containing protein [Variovorax sp. J22R133]MDM0114379.1 PAS domain-containing protein [Variovorax sp. J22R133]
MMSDSSLPTTGRTAGFLDGGGGMGALMRSHDWSQSALGPPETWPQPLRTVVGLLLQSRFPMFVAWGEALSFLYNDPYAEILGAKHPRALGMRFEDIWSEIWPDISPLIDAAMAGQAIYREDLPLLMNRKGYDEQTWFTFSYSPLCDESGKIAGMFCAVSETTRRVLAERGLRELNETLERRVSEALAQRKLMADIVEGTNAFVQVADLDYRWLAINRSAADEFERIFGVRPKVGDSMLELLASQPAHQAAVKAVWSRALGGEEFVETGEFGDPARDRRFYEMRYSTLRGAGGARVGAYQFVYDVTERVLDQERLKKAEEALRQSQKLESLGRLTGGVAHDFNNLLAVFANGLQLLERGIAAEQRERVHAAMRRALARGTGLTHQLLAFTRRQPINPTSIDLATHLLGMREMLEHSLRGDTRVEMNFGADLWPVEIDAGEFELAMLNLFANARDAMPEGGVIAIDATNVMQAADEGPPAAWLQLSVADTGSGMPPEVLERAFEPFFTTKEVGKGSGLGLPQVYGFAQQSGGQLRIDSRIQVGTTVTLLLPRSLRQPAAPVDATSALSLHGDGNGRQVLLVEDDAEVAALTREMLGHLGFTVIHAASPAAALGALANARSIDVVFSDVMMPGGVSGVDLAREIRRRRPELPVVLTTGYSGAAGGMNHAEFRLLLKPYSLEALADALSVNPEISGFQAQNTNVRKS